MIDEERIIQTPTSDPPIGEQKASGKERVLTYIIASSILLLDLLTKLVVEDRLRINESYVPFESLEPFFKITHVSNTGAAFGLFPSGSMVIMVIAVIVSIVIIVYNQKLPANHKLFRLALGLQLGGALGNLLSRIRIGHVTDFLDFGPWPVSNVADTSIVLGTILLGLLMILEKEEESLPDDEISSGDPAENEHGETSEESPVIWNE
jgi:signal peptidase II